jgi:diguanylate cyclase (GGDEF)-like protein/PAS domain S-box-containing protein
VSILEPHIDKLKYIFDNAKVGIAICNAEDNCLEMVNPAFARIHGYEQHELIGASPGEVFAPECMLRLVEHESAPSACSMGDVSFETVHTKKDGSPVPVEVHIAIVKDEHGIVKHRIANILDITERKQNEENLQRTKTKLSAVISTIPDLIWVKDINGVYMMCNPAFENFFGAECSEIIGKTDYDFISREQADFFRQKDREAMEAGEMRINEEEIVFASDGSRAILETRKIPVYSGDDFMGVLGIGHDITEKKASEWKLRILSEALNASSESIFLIDPQNARFFYVNDTASKLLGYTKEELISGMGVFDIDPDMSLELWEEHVRDIIELGHVLIETRHRTKAGKVYPVEVIAHYFEYEGRKYNLAVTRDITEKKGYENALHAREREFRTITENSPDVIIRYNLSGERTYINPMGERLFGRSASEIIGRKATELSPIPAEIAFMDKFHEVIRTGHPIESETEFTVPGGGKGWGHMRIVPEFDEEGNVISVLTIGRDITERKRNEDRLKSHEERLREAQKIAKVGSWELDFTDMALLWSDEIYRIFEIEPDGESPKYADFINVIHPDDREFVDSEFHNSLNNKTAYDVVHRIQMSDGRIKYVHERGKTYYDTLDRPIRTLGTVQDITEQKAAEKKIAYMAHHDALTGLPNRTLAKERMEHSIAYAARSGLKTALLFIDLDGFKTINDTLGHSIGDAMLKTVAFRLKMCIRATDTVSRLGGDEFLVILSEVDTDDDIVTAVTKILEEFEASIHVLNHVLSVSMSIGVAVYPEHGGDFDVLLQKSDTAMYKAKESGKNTYRFFTEQMKHALIGQFKIQSDLKRALAENQLVLHYQPQIDLERKRIVGVEALIRWDHPQLGMIPPMQFIPLAESNGLIVPIGEWVIREACAQAARWQDMGIELCVAVNISGIQFKRGNLDNIVEEALHVSGIDPRFLELELTESIMMHDTEKTLETVSRLKNLGVQLSIDDFGTGYSSLAYLKRFAVDKLKIDQSFVRGILSNQEDAVIVSTIVQMAKSLNLKTIAEGVEDEEVLNVIEGYGCDAVQGYHFAKPMGAGEFEKYYNSQKV